MMKFTKGTAIYTGGGFYTIIGETDQDGIYFFGCTDFCELTSLDPRTEDEDGLLIYYNEKIEPHIIESDHDKTRELLKDFCERLYNDEPHITDGYEDFSNYIITLSSRSYRPGEIRPRKLTEHQGSVHYIRILAENFHYFGKGVEIHWLGTEGLTVHNLVHGEGHSVFPAHRRHFFESVRIPGSHEQHGVSTKTFVSYSLGRFFRSSGLAQTSYNHVSPLSRTADNKNTSQ